MVEKIKDKHNGFTGWVDEKIPFLGAIDDYFDSFGNKSSALSTSKPTSAEYVSQENKTTTEIKNTEAFKLINECATRTLKAEGAAAKPIAPSKGTILGGSVLGAALTPITISLQTGKKFFPNSLLGQASGIALDAVQLGGGVVGSLTEKAYKDLVNGNYAVIDKDVDGKKNVFLIPVDGDGKPNKKQILVIEGKTSDEVFSKHKSYEDAFGVNFINLPLTQRFSDLYNEGKSGWAFLGDAVSEGPAALNAVTQTNAGIIGAGVMLATGGAAASSFIGKSVGRVVELFSGTAGKVLKHVLGMAGKGYAVLSGIGFIAYGVYCGLTEPKGFLGTTANTEELNSALEKSDFYKTFKEYKCRQDQNFLAEQKTTESALKPEVGVSKDANNLSKEVSKPSLNTASDKAVETKQSKSFAEQFSPTKITPKNVTNAKDNGALANHR